MQISNNVAKAIRFGVFNMAGRGKIQHSAAYTENKQHD